MDISNYRLTIIAAAVVLVLSAALVTIFGSGEQSKQYLTLVGTIAIPGLFALFKTEQNSIQNNIRHQENQDVLAKLVTDNQTFGEALLQVSSDNMSVKKAAQIAGKVMRSDPTTESTTESTTTNT